MGTLDQLAEVVTGARQPTPQFPRPEPAKVSRLDGLSVYVTLDALLGQEFGPVKYGKPVGQAAPPVGTACLVMFAGFGVDAPWVVGWAGWPA